MASRQNLRHTLRYTLGFRNLQDVSQLALLEQNMLERSFDATPNSFAVQSMGRIYMRWLLHQDFPIIKCPQSKVVKQWVSFVDSWGISLEYAITLWAKSNDEDTVLDEDEKRKQWREKRNYLRHEIEHQFLKLKNPGPKPPSNSIEGVHPRDNHKTRGRMRKFDEYNDAKTKSALKNWPTKDIPFSSIETATSTDTEAEETRSSDVKEGHENALAKKRAMLAALGGL